MRLSGFFLQVVLAAILCLAVAWPSQAFFTFAPDPGTDYGASDGDAVVVSFGTAIPLQHAIPMIVPSGYAPIYEFGAHEARQVKVTWSQASSWAEALQDVCSQAGVHCRTDEVLAKVHIEPLDAAERRPSISPAEQSPSGESFKPEDDGEFLRIRSPEDEGSVQSWSLVPGSFKRQLEQWSEAGGYQCVWSLPNDYDITAKASVRGTFLQAVKKVMEGLRAAGAAVRVHVYKANKVILVRGE